MSDTPTKAARNMALELHYQNPGNSDLFTSFALYIDKVDRVARDADHAFMFSHEPEAAVRTSLRSLMLPDPEPDPLVEICKSLELQPFYAVNLRRALDVAGLEVRPKRNDDDEQG